MRQEMVAMLLAGGKGTRLHDLTKNMAKPAVEFGGRYRLIDFPLTNCSHSQITSVGVLTQYEPIELNHYIGNGSVWDLDLDEHGIHILSPFSNSRGSYWFNGTAHAIWAHFEFLRSQKPEYVLILSGDHIYNMDYQKMLSTHKKMNNSLTICVKDVPLNEASRFGLAVTNDDDYIVGFEEKPENPSSTLASMGIYIFNYDVLEKYLEAESYKKDSEFDFGKNVIPSILNDNLNIGAYRYEGYWKDVGTVASLWEANMDLLSNNKELIYSSNWPLYSKIPSLYPSNFKDDVVVSNSIINEGSRICGDIKESVISYNCNIGCNSKINKSVVNSNVNIGENVILEYCIVKSGTNIDNDITILGTRDNIILVTQDYISAIKGDKNE